MSPILTISSYHVHHIVARFIKLYRRVQVVSNCLTFACSMLCCQCGAMLPETTREMQRKLSAEEVLFLPNHIIEARKASGEPLRHPDQELFIYREDTAEAQEKCIQFWKMVNSKQRLPEDHINQSKCDSCVMDQTATGSHRNMITPRDELPAIHTKSTNKNAVLKSPSDGRRVSFTKCC